MNPISRQRHAFRLHRLAALEQTPVEDIDHLLARCSTRELPEGAILVRQGSDDRDLYLLLEGEVEVRQWGEDGASHLLATLTAPEVFGHMAAVDARPRSASVVAATPCLVATVPHATVEDLLGSATPEGTALRRILLKRLHHTLSRTNAQLVALVEQLHGIADLPAMWVRAASSSSLDSLSDEDLLELAGLAEGWDVDLEGLDEVDVEPVHWDE